MNIQKNGNKKYIIVKDEKELGLWKADKINIHWAFLYLLFFHQSTKISVKNHITYKFVLCEAKLKRISIRIGFDKYIKKDSYLEHFALTRIVMILTDATTSINNL